MLTDVPFHELAEWEQGSALRHVWVWLAFERRLVATGEHEGPEQHAGVWSPRDFLTTWPERLVDTPGAWLLPHVERMTTGLDVRGPVLAAYAERHGGGEPPVVVWPLRL